MTPSDLPAQMTAKIRLDGDCWTWTGAQNGRGYGSVGVNRRVRLAHRRSYELLVGVIPDGLQIDHLCRNRLCVNPQHLEPVTAQENNRRKPLVEVCPKGHLKDGENLRVKVRSDGRVTRECRACHLETNRENYRRRFPERKYRLRSDRINTDAFLA